MPNQEQEAKVKAFEAYNFGLRPSGRATPRFHDNDVRLIQVLPPKGKKDPSTVELTFFDREEGAKGVERLLRIRGCASLRFSIDFDILADNTSGPHSSAGQTSNVEVSGCKDCIGRALKQGVADWNVEYQGSRETPASYRLYRLQQFILVKVWLSGGVMEIVGRDFEIETKPA